jgi:signal transduction histidine kinase
VKDRRWLVAVLWVVGLAAVVAGFVLLFENPGTPTWTEIVNRAAGGSFIVCGLIVWQRRPDSRTGLWMTATGFLYLGPQLLEEIDTSLAFTIGELFAVVWLVPFAALVLGYPTGRLTTPADRIPVAVFAFGTTVMQLVWLLFLPADGYDNVLMIWSDAGAADAIDTTQRTINSTAGAAVAVIALARWWRAAPALRRLLLPVLAGGIAAAVLAGQAYYRLLAGEWMRPTFEITSVVLFLIPLAFLVGALRAQMARAGMADLVVALHRAPDAKGLGAVLARTLRDPSLVLVYWLPGFETYVDDEGKPVALPAAGSGRAATPVMHDGEPVAALVHDAALTYEPELLEVVTAAADVALERRRLHAELESRVEELAGSRARIVEASDAARRQIERDLHDGAQQRLVSLAIALRVTEDRIKDDPETAATLVAAARRELTESLEELRELARGIHPAVLEHGLDAALQSLATRSQTPVRLDVELDERLPVPVELAAYFVACEGLANVGKYAQASKATIRVRRDHDVAVIEIRDDGIGGADAASGSGLRGLADRVEALGGRLSVSSPAGGGTTLAAELPVAVRPAAR